MPQRFRVPSLVPPGFVVEHLDIHPDCVGVVVRSGATTGACPSSGALSRPVQSRLPTACSRPSTRRAMCRNCALWSGVFAATPSCAVDGMSSQGDPVLTPIRVPSARLRSKSSASA